MHDHVSNYLKHAWYWHRTASAPDWFGDVSIPINWLYRVVEKVPPYIQWLSLNSHLLVKNSDYLGTADLSRWQNEYHFPGGHVDKERTIGIANYYDYHSNAVPGHQKSKSPSESSASKSSLK